MKTQLSFLTTINSDQKKAYNFKKKKQKQSKIRFALKKIIDLITR